MFADNSLHEAAPLASGMKNKHGNGYDMGPLN